MKKYILLFSLFLSAILTGRAQQTLLVPDNTRNISFSDSEIILTNTQGEESFYPLAKFRVLVFDMNSSSGTTATDNRTISQNPVVYSTAAGNLIVESEEPVNSLSLFDLNGKTLRTVEIRHAAPPLQTAINVSALPAGIYILHIETEKGTVSKKIVIQ